MRARWACPLVLASLLAAAANAAALDARLAARARGEGAVRVVVALRRPEAPAHGAEARRRAAAVRRGVMAAVAADAMAVHHEFGSASGFVATVNARGLDALAAHPDVVRIDADREGGGGLAVSVPQIRADRVHARGLVAAGVTIAVLDTGVDPTHPDLAPALEHEECFCAGDCCPNRRARQSGPGSARSRHEHGVHVSGIAVSRGAVADLGVAPGARLLAIKVLNDENRGFLSDWVAGLDWVVSERPDVRVVNMSLVSDALYSAPCDAADATTMMFAELIETFRERGGLVFAAAGNNGDPGRLTAPACVGGAIAVGAVDRQDAVADFSNGGTGLDLLAPGVGILSDSPGGGLTTLSGTSMASPHAAGAAALLIGAVPGLHAEDVETILRDTGVEVFDPRTGLTHPRIEALRALDAAARSAERLRGGGSGANDCIVEWNFVPPAIAVEGPHPHAVCRDGDVLCDDDRVDGQCTFLLSLCFAAREPLLPDCRTDEAVFFAEPVWPSSQSCVGDCDLDGTVAVNELVRAVQIGLGETSAQACLAADRDADGSVSADELVAAVGNAGSGCTARTDVNLRRLFLALPRFPIRTPNLCSSVFRVSVPRGVSAARLVVRTQTRNDYDRVSLVCEGGTGRT